MEGDNFPEVCVSRQPQMVERTLNFLDLKMNENGTDHVSKTDLNTWKQGASTDELAMLGFAELSFDDIRNQNQADNGGVLGMFAGNADDITKSDTSDLRATMYELRENALSQQEIDILRSLGPSVTLEQLKSAKATASPEQQAAYDDMIAIYDGIRSLDSDDKVVAMTVPGVNGRPVTQMGRVNDPSVTSSDVDVAQEHLNGLAYWDAR